MSKLLFVTGTARGGTTFLTRILSMNDRIKVASDPFLPVFRSLRTAIMHKYIDPHFNPDLPLSDYYYSDHRNCLQQIQKAGLDIEISGQELDKVRSQVAERMKLAEKGGLGYLDLLTGKTYFETIKSSFLMLEKMFNCSGIPWCGFKDLWITEFFPLLAR